MKKSLAAIVCTAALGLVGTSALAAQSVEDRTEGDYKVAKAEAERNYDSAKAACKDLKGSEERACKKDAKAAYEKAIDVAKATRKEQMAQAPRNK